MSDDLLTAARAGDGKAFEQLVAGYRRELHLHCYRLLGSLEDAEDAMQDTLLAAWRGLAAYQQRASLRTWLYRIATNRCLSMLRPTSRRANSAPSTPAPTVTPPPPSALGEVPWLQPYPDVLLEQVADPRPGPAARYESREAISLAFITAVQLLPPRQRAVLILRDVLAFPAAEVAGMLETTGESVTSALKRARATVAKHLDAVSTAAPPPPTASTAEQALVAGLTRALEAGDIDGLVALLTDDVRMSMPPMPLEYHGRGPVAEFFRVVAFRNDRTWRLINTRANGQPALGVYLPDPQTGIAHANGLLVLTLAADRITAITRFDNTVLPSFGLPRILKT